MNSLHDCSYGRPYLLGFREIDSFMLFLRDSLVWRRFVSGEDTGSKPVLHF